jgi:polyisoprenoid-binding protein YceI
MDSNAQNFIVAVLAGTLAVAVLAAATYDLGPSEGSRFALEVYKTGLMAGKKHVFLFERFSGEATEDKVRFVVDARSVQCTDTWVNEGSRKKIELTARDQMMQADKYPEMVFTSSNVGASGDVEGTLTIRGIARPVVVHVKRIGEDFEGSAVVKLSNWGLKAPSSGLSLGLIGTKDEMMVQFRIKPKTR